MVNQVLVDYLKEGIKRGFSLDYLKEHLKKNGQVSSDVDDAASFLKDSGFLEKYSTFARKLPKRSSKKKEKRKEEEIDDDSKYDKVVKKHKKPRDLSLLKTVLIIFGIAVVLLVIGYFVIGYSSSPKFDSSNSGSKEQSSDSLTDLKVSDSSVSSSTLPSDSSVSASPVSCSSVSNMLSTASPIQQVDVYCGKWNWKGSLNPKLGRFVKYGNASSSGEMIITVLGGKVLQEQVVTVSYDVGKSLSVLIPSGAGINDYSLYRFFVGSDGSTYFLDANHDHVGNDELEVTNALSTAHLARGV